MKKEFLSFFAALVLYTKIPCPFELTEVHFRSSARYFTLIGWIAGMLSACVFLLLRYLFSVPVSLLLTLLFTVLITGGVNEQGLSAVCNGFGKGWSKDGILTIMKDAATGIFGVIAVVFIVLLKFVSLVELNAIEIPFYLIAGMSVSRLFAVSLAYSQEYIYDIYGSKSLGFVKKLTFWQLLFSAFAGLIPLFLLGNYYIFLAILPLLLVRWLLGRFYEKWIGGYTTECIYTTQLICEIVFYLFALAAPWKFFLQFYR